MMQKNKRVPKISAWVCLVAMSAQIFCPGIAYALTSGPAQPEATKFEVAGVTDMVDLVSGDFKQNIPLMEVGGYPINLSYQSGSEIEDEASWVGVGWTVNPGSVNRNMRGIPDDFNSDSIQKHFEIKPFRKVGGSIQLKTSVFAKEVGKASLSLKVYKDNYYGIAASIGAGLSSQVAQSGNTSLTAGLSLNSDTREGVNVTPSLSLEISDLDNKQNAFGAGISSSLNYGSRTGLKSMSLSSSFNVKKIADEEPSSIRFNTTHYFGLSYTPLISNEMRTQNYTLSFDLGATYGIYKGSGGSGFVSFRDVKDKDKMIRSYGYLNYLKGRNDPDVLIDFNREKDGVFLTSTPVIPVPVATQDFFVASGQTGAQQFKPYLAGDYVVFDKAQRNTNSDLGLGVTIGVGNVFKAGGRIEFANTKEYSTKWTQAAGNRFLNYAEALQVLPPVVDPLAEPVYFKQVGEHVSIDRQYFDQIGADSLQQLDLRSIGSNKPMYRTASLLTPVRDIARTKREKRNYGFSYLNAGQASVYGLDKTINGAPRVSAKRKAHHMSEITVTSNDGKRMVYGIPVYNYLKKEVSFSVAHPEGSALNSARRNGLINYQNGTDQYPQHTFGRSEYLMAETVPAYSTSFLLTAVLSPDYVDVKHDGVTDDDLGTAVKFQYKQMPFQYKWRAPYDLLKANFNESSISDPKDDMASYTYGEKEIWYVNRVESKTMVALFYTSNREDALGVTGESGGKNLSARLQKLDSIRLFSKSDLVMNGDKATPIKVVHFRYDYSLYPGVPNNSGFAVMDPDHPSHDLNARKGKLTLRKVFFTFGKNQRGQTNPYEFFYRESKVRDLALTGIPVANNPALSEYEESYEPQQQDRWGVYKPAFYNMLFNGQGSSRLENAEFPYTLQANNAEERKLADHFASKWQLEKIITPAGSTIEMVYESDDYAYVQDRKAMQMCWLMGVNASGRGFTDANELVIKLPQPVSGDVAFREKYLTGMEHLYYRVMVDMDNRGHYEPVSGYAELDRSASRLLPGYNDRAIISVKKVNGYNPIAKAAWQKLQTDFPQYAYDNYDNTEVSSDFVAAIKSLITSVGNLRELIEPFDNKAVRKKYATRVDYNKSMVRLLNPNGKKIGGGVRVKKITISDNWDAMTSQPSSAKAVFGQTYDYTIRNNDGSVISSGVASYEPQSGNDENPFHEPLKYTEKVHWSQDKYHYVEMPFCESYFPTPVVAYSKVTVTSFGESANQQEHSAPAGYTENEFYTAKDFPTIVTNTSLEQQSFNSSTLKLFASNSTQNKQTSQGFNVELNDMHGKPKAVKTYDAGGALIASSEYFYSATEQQTARKRLNNQVDVLQADGTISPQTMVATDVELVTDVREHHNEFSGKSIGAYVGGMVIPFPFPPYLPYAAVQVDVSREVKNYKSISRVKVIHKYGILTKVRTMQNGSTTEAENLLWDGLTGEVLLSRTQNAFNDHLYNFFYPAYMVNDYRGMGAATINSGATFLIGIDQQTGLINGTGTQHLTPGDELIAVDQSSGIRAWVINTSSSDDFPQYKLIDEQGELIMVSGYYTVLRSGKRNILNASAGTVISTRDPRVSGRLVLDQSSGVLDAKSIAYSQNWSMAIPDRKFNAPVCPPGYITQANGSCYTVTPALPSGTAFQVCKTANYDEYAACGTAIYDTANVDGSYYRRRFFSASNNFWSNTAAARQAYCNYTLPSSRGGVILQSLPASSSATTTNTVVHDSVPVMQGAVTVSPSSLPQPVYYGPLNRTGIWACNKITNTWIGFTKVIQVPAAKVYYLGIGADNNYRVKVNGHLILNRAGAEQESFRLWHIYPIRLAAGVNTISIEALDLGGIQAFGAELYNNTISEIEEATNIGDLNIVFSTNDLIGAYLYEGSFYCASGSSPILNLQQGTSGNPFVCMETVSPVNQQICADPLQKLINPYTNNLKGNWHPQSNYVYTINRTQIAGNPTLKGGTDIRRSGTYANFTPFWQFSNGVLRANLAADAENRWISANSSVYYDQQGNEIESVDALQRYSSALYGYRNSLATAVAANSRHNEMMFEGFEDYGFTLSDSSPDCKVPRHFDWNIIKTGQLFKDPAGNQVYDGMAHSGKYSYKLTAATTIVKATGSAVASALPFLIQDQLGRYLLNGNELGKGYAPVGGKKQILSLWVYDGNEHTNKITNLTIQINGITYDLSNTVVPVVEGWKRLELSFMMEAGSNSFSLTLQPTGTVYIDDVRLHPFDADMKSFVYNDQSLRLMSQLDENNFATFYEYDDEGTLIRVKKETDRGIMTISETRQSFRRRN